MRRIAHRFLAVLFFATIILFVFSNKAYCQINQIPVQKIFSLGRGVGASYYYLTDLCDKARSKPYSALKKEYNNTFQSLNIMEIILNDLDTDTNSHASLNKLKNNFYNSLKDQDLNELQLLQIRKSYIYYYETLAKTIQRKYSSEGSWLLALGFYSSFQMESLNSSSKLKLLLSGFDKILNSNPLTLPEEFLTNLKTINSLDKTIINDNELECLKKNIINITEYFSNYPENKALSDELKEFTGVWQGILINSENKNYNLKLIVNDDMTIKMDINGIAQNILISDIKIINNYLTFMFKPLGDEKLYIKFNAKKYNNILTCEVVDVLGQKGNSLLSKTN